MTIDDMLNFMAAQGIGNDSPTDSDKAIYLKYLNIAHDELYRLVILFSDTKSAYATLQIVDGNALLPADLLRIGRATDVDHTRNLEVMDITLLEEHDPLLQRTGSPFYYYVIDGSIYTYPTSSHTLKLRYFKVPGLLTLSSGEQDVPYPKPFHHVLVDGALYYLLQAEGGFKTIPKMQAAAIRWQSGKTALISFLTKDDAPIRVISEDF